jgi:ribose transport system ATP-binding protein
MIATSDTQPSAGLPAGGEVALRLSGVGKAFGQTVALTDVSLECRGGTVHTILGENGSGKSTLVKLLSGVLAPDEGTVEIGGRALRPCTPATARRLGVGTVFQEVLVAPNRSVTENVLLGQDGWWRWQVAGARRRERAASVLREISSASFDFGVPVGELSLVQQHQVAIARALSLRPRILILDESTAALDVGERDALLARIRSAAAEGVAVIFISHRLDEVLELSDAVTVLRSGRVVQTLGRDELSVERLIRLLSPEEAVL